MDVEPVDVEKVAEENPQSRFRILNTAVLKPGVCALCGSAGGDGRQFVDFGKTMDWYGCIYFCTFCIAEAARLIGFVPGLDMEKFLKDRKSLQQAMSDHIKELQGKLDAAMVLVRNCTCADSGIGDRTSPVSETDVEDPGDPEPEPESSYAGKSDADESDPVEGPDDVPADSGDDEFTASGKPRRTRKSAG